MADQFMTQQDRDTIRLHCQLMEDHTNAIHALLESKKLDRLIDALESIPDSIEVEIQERK